MLPQELEMHRGNVDTMSSDLLRAFSYEGYSHTQDCMPSLRLKNHTLNNATQFRPEISDSTSELRNEATRL